MFLSLATTQRKEPKEKSPLHKNFCKSYGSLSSRNPSRPKQQNGFKNSGSFMHSDFRVAYTGQRLIINLVLRTKFL
jgi:hypothetical protein